jgi:DNA-directed RNA polymerase omega subunit
MTESSENNHPAPLTGALLKEMLKPDESVFELVTVAAQRCKQLVNGASPKITDNLWKRKNTRIALEEVRLGLIPFTTAADAEPPLK